MYTHSLSDIKHEHFILVCAGYISFDHVNMVIVIIFVDELFLLNERMPNRENDR